MRKRLKDWSRHSIDGNQLHANPTMDAAIDLASGPVRLSPMKPERLYSLYRTGVKLSPAEIAAARAWAEEHGMWWPDQTA